MSKNHAGAIWQVLDEMERKDFDPKDLSKGKQAIREEIIAEQRRQIKQKAR